jgi:hypothetical protein
VRVSGNLVTSSAEVLRTVLLSGGGIALAAPFIADMSVERFVEHQRWVDPLDSKQLSATRRS